MQEAEQAPSPGRRYIISASEHIPPEVFSAVFGSSVSHIAPVEKKDVPKDNKQLWAVRKVQTMAVCAVMKSPRTAEFLARADDDYFTSDPTASAAAAEAADGQISSAGHVIEGMLYSEAPELPTSLLDEAYSAFHCLYDLAPLRPGLRVVRDGLLNGSDELSALLQFARAALEGATSLGARASVALTLDECGSEEGSALLHNVRERCRVAIGIAFGEREVFHSGALITRVVAGDDDATLSAEGDASLSAQGLVANGTQEADQTARRIRRDDEQYGAPRSPPAPCVDESELPSYCHAHVDKCSILSYDLSAVLYLTECRGGSFAFLDSDGVDRHVEPRSGRLLGFASGVENVHRVCRVADGERIAIAMWFTLSKDHRER